MSLDVGAVVSTRRSASTRRPELALMRGPLVLGQAGQSWSSLLGARWALAWSKVAGLELYQLQGQDWAAVVADLPTLPGGARHLSACFDQSAHPVIAWEVGGAVFVRQFDPGAGVYVLRGPLPGCDPVLLFDARITGQIAGSDVALFHLSLDRRAVLARLQRTLYASAVQLSTLGVPGVLDQALALPWRVELVGDGPNLLSDLYPVQLGDVVGFAASGLGSAALVAVTLKYGGADQGAATASGLGGAALVAVTLAHSRTDQGGAAASAVGPAVYQLAVIKQSGQNAVSSSASGLTGGRYE